MIIPTMAGHDTRTVIVSWRLPHKVQAGSPTCGNIEYMDLV